MPSPRDIAIGELRKRLGILNACFTKQREPIIGAIERKERQIAILTSRRAGKTNTVLRAICRDALDNPKRKYAYIGLSRVTAENIVWKELEAISEAHDLKLDLQGYRLRAIFPNGADITLYGADQPGWLKKFKGSKYRGVVIDEAGEFDIDLQDFIYRVIRPTLTDLRGTLWLIGTPGELPIGYWYAVTNPDISKRVRGWSVYRWHTFDNPYIVEQYKEDMAELRDTYGDALETLPWYRREWLGEWCFDSSNRVYKFEYERNTTDIFEPAPGDQYIMAIDPGLVDAAAFLVACYNPRTNDRLTFLECHRQIGMDLDSMADLCEKYYRKYPGLRMIGDSSAAHFMQMIREKRSLPIEDALKQDKISNIEYMNNGFVSGKILLKMPECTAYAKEISALERHYIDAKTYKEGRQLVGEWKEHPKQPNDLCDCGLYINRVALPYTFKEPTNRPKYGTPEYYQALEEKIDRQAFDKVTRPQQWWREQ